MRAALIQLEGEFQRALECLLGTIPFPDEREIYCQVVIAKRGVRLVFRPLVITDGLFQMADAVVRPAQEPAGPSHVAVDFPEQVGRGTISYELGCLL